MTCPRINECKEKVASMIYIRICLKGGCTKFGCPWVLPISTKTPGVWFQLHKDLKEGKLP